MKFSFGDIMMRTFRWRFPTKASRTRSPLIDLAGHFGKQL